MEYLILGSVLATLDRCSVLDDCGSLRVCNFGETLNVHQCPCQNTSLGIGMTVRRGVPLALQSPVPKLDFSGSLAIEY